MRLQRPSDGNHVVGLSIRLTSQGEWSHLEPRPVIGPDLAVARFLLSLTFGVGIGLIMALIYQNPAFLERL